MVIDERVPFPDTSLGELADIQRLRNREAATSLDGLRAIRLLSENRYVSTASDYMPLPGSEKVLIHKDIVADTPFRAGSNVTTAIFAESARRKRVAYDAPYWEQHLNAQPYQGV